MALMSDAVAESPKLHLQSKFAVLGFSAISGILLILSFPPFNLGLLAWFSLVPLLVAIQNCTSRRNVLLCGLTTGLVFFTVSLHWLTHVTFFGWLILVIMESAYLMVFGLLAARGLAFKNDFLAALWIALSWTSLEWMRSEIPVFGFGWNLLGYSQTSFPWILQSANTIGGYGLGFVIAGVNICFFQTASIFLRRSEKRWASVACHVSLVFLIFAALLCHGAYHFNRKNKPDQSVSISLIQGNIPQDIKWEPVAREKIIDIYLKLTQLAGFEEPDVILWPEAAFPGYFNRDSEAEKIRALVREIRIPLVLGSPHFENWNTAFNSAYLLSAEGHIETRYDKLNLVPFGEYVPLKPFLGWLEPMAYSLGVSDFIAGTEYTIFKLPDGTPFSVLICFEDIFPNLARRFVDHGARFLAVMTNDAWFGESAAPYQHLQASIFRAVENGVPIVRAANTGVSAFISRKGIVLDRVQDEKGKDIFVFGRKTLTLPLENGHTLYRKGGYLFPYLAFLVFGVMFVMSQFRQSLLR